MAKNGFKVLDSDMHIVEPWDLWLQYIEPKYRERAPVGAREYPLDFGLLLDGEPISAVRSRDPITSQESWLARLEIEEPRLALLKEDIERQFDSTSQLQAMDREGIDVTVLFPTRGLAALSLDYPDTKLAAAVARAYNNWLADFCKGDPTRLYGSAMLSVHDVEEAVAEARRAKVELGFKAVFFRPNPVRGRNWHDPAYDPLWEECQRLGLAVGFHEGQPTRLPQAVAERFNNEPEKNWTMAHVASHPMEQMYATLCMTTGGVLERFPQLRVAFLEANCSWVPYWLWRMDEHYEAREKWASKTVPMKPSEYFRQQCFTSVEASEEPAKYVIDWMGDDNIVFSTDYPHLDSAYPHSIDRFLSLSFDDGSRRKILWDNCARLYDL